MLNILVTGGAGYIGSVLVPELLRNNYRVTVIDNFMFNQNSLLDAAYNSNLEVIRGDITDKFTLEEHISKNDIIIPLAALVGAPLCNSNTALTQSTNTDQIRLISELSSKDQQILFPVTNSGYGIGKKDLFCDENSELNPISLYGKTKVEAEKILLDKGNAITFRLATVFGTSPRMRMDLLVNDFVFRAVKDRFIVLYEPHFKRNYIHIRDITSVFLHGLSNFSEMKGEPFNVGLSDANLSKMELCERIKKHINDFYFFASDLSTDPDKRDYIVSNEKIEATGWKPSHSLDDGIQELKKTYSWLKTNEFSNI
tara:strand:+ start:1400 stop:2335 length:936 start_codon:yes stop_codon:yes gene_type:complete